MERTNRSIRASPDRLSSLPESVLCHILSFVPTKNSVATSILAKRWKYLWADVPVLDFNGRKYKAVPGKQMSYPDIINRVIMLHNVRRVNSFRLSLLLWDEEEDFTEFQIDTFIDTWIRTVIARNVKALYLAFDYKSPLCIFTCKTLVDLQLQRCVIGIIPQGAVCLPSLKNIYLLHVNFEVDETLHFLISGCPVLEELEVCGVSRRDVEQHCCITITSPTIKRLKLDLYLDCFALYGDYGFKVDIKTPALRYLVVEDYFSKHISSGTLNSLVEADVLLYGTNEKDDALYSCFVLEFVEKLRQVKCLKFGSDYKKFLYSAFAASTTRFHNLTKLEFGADWRLLRKFLESADNLEVLIISEVDEEDLKCWVEPEKVPTCLSSRLRTVTVEKFGCSEYEFKMVSYIMRNAKVLNTMKICEFYPEDDWKSAIQRISMFERGSETCKLEIVPFGAKHN